MEALVKRFIALYAKVMTHAWKNPWLWFLVALAFIGGRSFQDSLFLAVAVVVCFPAIACVLYMICPGYFRD